MKKIMLSILVSCVSFSALAAQPVSDIEVVNELKQIRSILEKNTQKNYTCTDGEKNYTVGLSITKDGATYRCDLKGDHTEWAYVPRL
ncbi:TPA: hypothetical protein ACQ39K_004746 [Yersinia enterocolitica]